MLKDISLELRANPASMMKEILRYLSDHNEIELDCGHTARRPEANVVLVETDTGLHLAVCPECEGFATDEFNGGTTVGKYDI